MLERFDLVDAGRRLVRTYSGGMRRRLDLAASLIGRPSVIFLDEPTTGLDPLGRRDMWAVVGDLAASGVTVFLTTQYLEEADQLAERIALIDRGKLVAEGSADQLKARVAGQRLDLVLTDASAYAAASSYLAGLVLVREPAQRLIGVATDGSATHIRRLLDDLDRQRIDVDTLSLHAVSLDDVFLSLTGRNPESQASERGAVAATAATPKEIAHV